MVEFSGSAYNQFSGLRHVLQVLEKHKFQRRRLILLRAWRKYRDGIALALQVLVHARPRMTSVSCFWAGALILQACIFQNPHFESASNYPPMIATNSTSPFPLNRVIRIRADQVTGGTARALQFVVDVRDPDVDQVLHGELFVDSDPRFVSFTIQPVPSVRGTADSGSMADRTLRSLAFTVQGTFLSEPTCHRIELLVSGGFQENSREPVENGDVAQATWWVATQDAQGSSVNMRNCLAVEGFGQ